jgi:hypothetical protein
LRSEVIGVDRNDLAHSVAEIHGRRQGECGAHGFARQREVGQVEILDDPDDRGAQRRLLVVGARDDVGPSYAGEVDRVDREPVGDQRDDALEVVELRTHRVVSGAIVARLENKRRRLSDGARLPPTVLEVVLSYRFRKRDKARRSGQAIKGR